MSSVFEKLAAVNVNGHTEQKNGLTYLSWAWAWQAAKELFPDATYTVYENKDGWCYHTDGKTCWVKTGVTISGQEYIEFLPVMDNRNKSITLENVTSFDVNKAIQRSLTKALARHGLGLYIYAGEDLPMETTITCEDCGKPIEAAKSKAGKILQPCEIKTISVGKFGRAMCAACQRKAMADIKKTEEEQQNA